MKNKKILLAIGIVLILAAGSVALLTNTNLLKGNLQTVPPVPAEVSPTKTGANYTSEDLLRLAQIVRISGPSKIVEYPSEKVDTIIKKLSAVDSTILRSEIEHVISILTAGSSSNLTPQEEELVITELNQAVATNQTTEDKVMSIIEKLQNENPYETITSQEKAIILSKLKSVEPIQETLTATEKDNIISMLNYEDSETKLSAEDEKVISEIITQNDPNKELTAEEKAVLDKFDTPKESITTIEKESFIAKLMNDDSKIVLQEDEKELIITALTEEEPEKVLSEADKKAIINTIQASKTDLTVAEKDIIEKLTKPAPETNEEVSKTIIDKLSVTSPDVKLTETEKKEIIDTLTWKISDNKLTQSDIEIIDKHILESTEPSKESMDILDKLGPVPIQEAIPDPLKSTLLFFLGQESGNPKYQGVDKIMEKLSMDSIDVDVNASSLTDQEKDTTLQILKDKESALEISESTVVKPSRETMIAEQVVADIPAEEPLVEEDIAEQDYDEEPIIEEEIWYEEPIIDEETFVDDMTEEPIIDEEAIVEEQIVEEQIVEEQVVEEAIAGEPETTVETPNESSSPLAMEECDDTFIDISLSDWHQPYECRLERAGIINGRSPSIFAPNSYITKAEVVKLVLGMAGYTYADTANKTPNHPDVSNSNDWYYRWIGLGDSLNLTRGLGENYYPNEPAT
ncbi:hypothetical protein KKC60_01855, partial [Patescibacteria group bacterium]|nr:hypothetical protein [Patescibacteria group bacterium]